MQALLDPIQGDLICSRRTYGTEGFETSAIYSRLNTRIQQHVGMRRMSNGWEGGMDVEGMNIPWTMDRSPSDG